MNGTSLARSPRKPWRSNLSGRPLPETTEPPPHSMNLIAAIEARLGTGWSFTGELGTGATSRVYLAKRESDGERVVVKLMKSGAAAAERAQYFLLEMQILQKLSHPNIVPISDAGEAQG